MVIAVKVLIVEPAWQINDNIFNNMTSFQIFFDLDDTLIYSTWNPGSEKYTCTRKFNGEIYGSIERPMAKQMIEFARSIDPNPKIITTATREWAEHWNEVFEFGFDTIYSREDFTKTSKKIYGGEVVDNNSNCLNVERGCIIDNYLWTDPSPIHKMKFVFGRVDARYWIHLKPFTGVTNEEYKIEDQKRFEKLKMEITSCL